MKKHVCVCAIITLIGFCTSSYAITEHYWRFEQPTPYHDEGLSAMSSLSLNGSNISIEADTATNAPGSSSMYMDSSSMLFSSFNTPAYNNFTVELFIKPSNLNDSSLISDFFSLTVGPLTRAVSLQISSGKIDLFGFQSATTLLADQWYHLAVTYSYSTDNLLLYIDGSLDANFPQVESNVRLSHQITFGDMYEGYMDEIRVSSEVLDPSQFLNTYSAPVVPEPASLLLFGAALIRLVVRRGR